MYRQTWNVILESTSKLMLMSCFLLKQAWMNFLKVRRCQESGSVLCIQGPFLFKDNVGLSFHCMLGLLCEQDKAFSVLSAFQSRVWSTVCSVAVMHKRKKKNTFASQLQMGFPVSVVVLLLHPAFTCESIRLPIPMLKAVSARAETSFHFHHCSFHHCCPAQFVERMCCTYRWSEWPTPVWACLDFILWSFLSFFSFFFISKLQWLLFLGSLLICFPQVFQ